MYRVVIVTGEGRLFCAGADLIAYVYKSIQHGGNSQQTFSNPFILICLKSKIQKKNFDFLSNADGMQSNKVALITRQKTHCPTFMDLALSLDANPVNLLLQP